VINNSFSSPGGSAANSIFALARLGVSTGFLGAVGTDLDGERILTHMAQTGIDITKIKHLSGQVTAKVLVFVDNTGERAMYSLPGANTKFKMDDGYISYLKMANYLIISAIPGKKALEILIKTIQKLPKQPRIIFMPGGLYSNMGIDIVKPIIKKTHILILNRREFKLLTNSKTISEKSMSALTEIGCSNVVITLGKDGCILKTKDSISKIPTPILSSYQITDSTGAGDAFTAGVIYSLIKGKSFKNSCFVGNLLARRCIQSLGARSYSMDKVILEREFKRFSKEILL
jgi:ribokinase